MGNAIQLNFDKSTTNKIKKLWTSLKYHSICDFMIENDVAPHISLFVFDEAIDSYEEKVVTIVKDYFSAIESFDIDIYNIGIVPNDANVVYLSLIVTEKLLEIHRDLYELLAKEGLDTYIIDKCKPNQWKPYITMTKNINETDMIDAIKLLKRKFKSLKASFVSASYLSFYPIDYKMTLDLEGVRVKK